MLRNMSTISRSSNPVNGKGSTDRQRCPDAEIIIFVSPIGLRVVNPATTEKQARANTNLERAVAPELRELRRAVTRIGAGQ